MTKRTVLPVLLALCMFAINAQNKTLKFGHINSQELIQKMPEMEVAISKLEDMQTSNNERLKLLQSELQNQANAFQKIRATLVEADRLKREKELEQMSQNIQSFYQTAQEDMQKKQQELTQPIIDMARKAVEDVGKEQGFMYIFDISKGEVLYMGSQSVDVLPLVMKKLGIATAVTP
jgi:outer membrane protein